MHGMAQIKLKQNQEVKWTGLPFFNVPNQTETRPGYNSFNSTLHYNQGRPQSKATKVPSRPSRGTPASISTFLVLL